MEARIEVTNENLNFINVQRVRMEQILAILDKNPANNPEFTNSLEYTATQIKKLIGYEQEITKSAKLECQEKRKSINLITQKILNRIKERSQSH